MLSLTLSPLHFWAKAWLKYLTVGQCVRLVYMNRRWSFRWLLGVLNNIHHAKDLPSIRYQQQLLAMVWKSFYDFYQFLCVETMHCGKKSEMLPQMAFCNSIDSQTFSSCSQTCILNEAQVIEIFCAPKMFELWDR